MFRTILFQTKISITLIYFLNQLNIRVDKKNVTCKLKNINDLNIQ